MRTKRGDMCDTLAPNSPSVGEHSPQFSQSSVSPTGLLFITPSLQFSFCSMGTPSS